MKMTQDMQAAQTESLAKLREMLKPGDTVNTILRSASRSGMSRRISLVIARNNEVIDITWNAVRAMGEPVKQRGQYVQDAGIVVDGCGMDMGFHLVYGLSRTLFPDGFGEKGTHPLTGEVRPADREMAALAVERGCVFRGRNGDTSGWDDDGGYALKQRWL